MSDPKGLLRECAQSLLNAVNRLENSTPGAPSTTEQPSTTNITSTAHQVSAAEEHRNLFGYRLPCLSRSSNRPPPPKRRMVATSSGQRISVPERNT